jgi:hypothetical protein
MPKHIRKLKLNSIVVEPNVNQRAAGIDPQTVKGYADDMEAGEVFPPVVVFKQNKELFLADGFHRLAAARHLGWLGIECTVYKGGLREATVFACGSNARHGRRRSNADKRRSVATLLQLAPAEPDRAIARAAAVTHPFVAKVRRELTGLIEPDLDLPQVVAVTTEVSPATDRNLTHDQDFTAVQRHLDKEFDTRSMLVVAETLSKLSADELDRIPSDNAALADLTAAIWQRVLHELNVDNKMFFVGRYLPALGGPEAWEKWFQNLPESRQEFLLELDRLMEERWQRSSDGERGGDESVMATASAAKQPRGT